MIIKFAYDEDELLELLESAYKENILVTKVIPILKYTIPNEEEKTITYHYKYMVIA